MKLTFKGILAAILGPPPAPLPAPVPYVPQGEPVEEPRPNDLPPPYPPAYTVTRLIPYITSTIHSQGVTAGRPTMIVVPREKGMVRTNLPQHGEVRPAEGGILWYTSDPGYRGEDRFTALDSQGGLHSVELFVKP